MIMNEKHNQQTITCQTIYDAFKENGSNLAFFSKIHDSVKSRTFLEKVDYDGEKTCDYTEMLKDIIKTFDTSDTLAMCKAEALSDALFLYEGFAEGLAHDKAYHIHEDLLKTWKAALSEKGLKISRDLPEVNTNEVCETVYLGILEGEIEQLLVFKEVCKQIGIEFPVFESLKLETLSAVYDIYEAYVREQGYTDGDFESPECQEFYQRWQLALAEKIC